MQYLEDIDHLNESFSIVRLTYIPQIQNARADNLECGARNQFSYFVYMDTYSFVWLVES